MLDNGELVLNLAIWLQKQSQVSRQETALYFNKDAEQTYADLARSVAHITAWLIRNGLKCGNHVAILMKIDLSICECCFGYGIWEA